MPATYAHNRFGTLLEHLPADVRGTVERYRRLFDVGLHGPDLFFFYRPMFPTKIGRLGYKFHHQTGREFFSRVGRSLRLEPSEAARSYLYGVLCHFALDSHCHPTILEKSSGGPVSHSRIETEFDRYLMEKDGASPPGAAHLTERLVLTDQECALVSRFYPGTTQAHIRQSLWWMRMVCQALELPESPMNTALVKTVSAVSATFRDMVMGAVPHPLCQPINVLLLEQYTLAAERLPRMVDQLGSHLTYNAPLGGDFDRIFG